MSEKYKMSSAPTIEEIKKEMLDPNAFNERTGLPIVHPERGGFTSRRYHPPLKIDRENYIILRNIENRNLDYAEFSPYVSNQLIHVERIDTINFYPVDMHQALKLFLEYYGEGTLYIINGFQSAKMNGVNAHSVGLAVDIAADNKEHGRRIANAAYGAGFPNIVYGGDFNTKNGYIHIDICPKEEFAYDQGVYQGPWA